MKLIKGDIWKYHPDNYICVPTNVGWKKDGFNVMGRGLALQAADKFPQFPYRYGNYCKMGEHGVIAFHDLRLIAVPVKPLNEKAPWLSWKNPASLEMVSYSLLELSKGNPCRPACCRVRKWWIG